MALRIAKVRGGALSIMIALVILGFLTVDYNQRTGLRGSEVDLTVLWFNVFNPNHGSFAGECEILR